MRNSTTIAAVNKAIVNQSCVSLKSWLSKICVALTVLLFANMQVSLAQTPVPMGSQPGLTYTENFADIANWTNNFAAGIGASRWGSVAVNATGTVPDGVRTTAATATFTTGTSGGVQKGTGNIVQLSTGATNNTSANAIDFFLDFTGTNAGTLSFDWATVFNSTGDRASSIRVYTSINGTTFTELTAAQVLNKANNVVASGSIVTVSLPASFNNSATARIRFYEYNGTGGTTGSRAKISLDNVSVTAVATSYSVTYNGNGNTAGTAPFDPNSPYAAASNVTVLSEGSLVRTGYTFAGWNTIANGSGTAYASGGTITGIAANTTLFAQWTINTYTVTYDGNTNDGGTAPVDPNSPYNYNTNATVISEGTLTKTGFSFAGWNTAANGSGTAYNTGGTILNIVANITLFAQWIPANSYAVLYDGNGNTGGTAPVDPNSPYTAGSNVTVLSEGSLVRTGYTFSGWNSAANGSGTAYAVSSTISNISVSVTLFAQWTINTYTVTYDGNTNDGGTAPVDPNSPYNYNSNVTILGVGDLTKTNYNFTGWNTAADGNGTAYAAASIITGIAANVTLYAQWTIITYTVTYNGNTSTGGTAPVDPSSPYTIGSNVTVLSQGTLVKTGNTFAGWNTVADGSGTAYASAGIISNISANTILFAQWTVNTYTVTYDGNGNTGGTAPVDANSPYNFGTTVTVLANTGGLVRTGFSLVGWNTLADGTGTNYAATGSATFNLGAANVVLYAKWVQPFYEPFAYTAGDNIGGNTAASGTSNNNWTTHSNSQVGTIAVTSGSLSYTGLQVSTGEKIRLPGTNATVPRDVNRAISFAGATACYYSFLINVADATQLGVGGDYFFGFGGGSGASLTTLFSRLFIKSANGGTNFRLGVTNSTGGVPTITDFATDLNFATTYLVVVKHDLNGALNDISTLWVNPASLGGAEPGGGVTNNSGTAGQTSFASIFLRNTAATPKADIDEIRAGLSWADVTPAGVNYQLTVTAGTGGTITAPAVSPATVAQGASTTITAVPDAGYLFNGWTVPTGTASIANAALASTSVILSSGDATVQANFIPDTYTITASAGSGGSISPSGSEVVNAGTSPAFTITADPCSEITDIIVDGVSLNAYPYTSPYVHTFTNVAANHTISATFTSLTFTQWTGAVSSNWNDVANWTTCVPTSSLYVYIPGNGDGTPVVTQQPVLTADGATGDLEMGTNASVTIGGNTLTINGLYSDNGNASLIGSNTSNLVINGTNNVTFLTLSSATALTLKNLTINGGTTTLTTAVEITGGTAPGTAGVVSVASGAVLAADGFLTLRSNQFGTAGIGTGDAAGGYVTGDVTVERYIPNNGFRSWRLLSVPTTTTQTIRQAWQEGVANPLPQQNNVANYGTQITGKFTTQAAAVAAGFDSTSVSAGMLRWNGAAWSDVTSTNQAINNFNSYFLYIRGERSKTVTGLVQNTSATTLRTKGTVYTGDQTTNVGASSFALIPNLFPSAISFTGLTRTGGVNNLFYIWDSKKLNGSSLGTYQTFSATNSFNCLINGGSYTLGQPNTTIESGQSFFVTSGAAGTIILRESAKVSGTNGSLGFRPTPAAVKTKIDTRLYNQLDEMADANTVVFDAAYDKAVSEEDAPKMGNPGVNFAIETGGKLLAIEGTSAVKENDAIQFRMWNMQQQAYKIEFAASNMNITAGLTAMLEDSYLNTSTAISMEAATTVHFTVDANTASAAANRFKIVFRKAPVAADAKIAYSIAPNPATGGVINLSFKNQPQGKYVVRLTSTVGQVLSSFKIIHAGGNSTQVLNLPAGITPGIYQVEIIGADKTKTTQSLLVK